MATVIPITLTGNNLGQRHKYLNSLVNETHKKCDDFGIIKTLPEKSHIDRLFKIDLACKLEDVDYIMQTLKDDDMLYVSRALKSKWLLDPKYEEIINPEHLENHVYPEMITTAVNKMQHWIHLNLNDEVRCNKFFLFYQERNFCLALKFLLKCSKDDLEKEFHKIIHKITPHQLKVISEKSSLVTKIFFGAIATDVEVKRLYLSKQCAYFDTLRHLLKIEPHLVLDVTEKYFNNNVTNRFSAMQTKYIVLNHKDRFWKKPELYTSWLLDMQAVADSLNPEEAKELVLKLARAMYLTTQGWFDYKKVEPLIKRLKPEERAAFKKQVFVEKNVGDIEEIWPYEVPEPPANEIEYVTIFDDRQPEPNDYEILRRKRIMKRLIKKKCGPKCENVEIMCCEEGGPVKTLLDKLFDEFRFVSFGQTLYELRKRIAAESSPKNREFMMFVLISKTGGRPDAISLLLELLEKHSNEPVNVRAAVIRSLVKRAQVWRVPETSWDQLMKFGHGLGLDGKEPEAECNEGLHAVVIRSLLKNGECEPDIKNAFFKQFSTLHDYNLNSSEKKNISIALPKLIFDCIEETEQNIFVAGRYIEKLVKTLQTYKIKLDTYPGLIDAIIIQANKKSPIADSIIKSLYDAKIARKQLFPFTCDVRDECYLNALKHDPTILDESAIVDEYLCVFILRADNFFKKMSVYFSEENGVASNYLKKLTSAKFNPVIRKEINTQYRARGRLIAFLLNDQFESYLRELDGQSDQYSKLLASAIKANANLARPSLDINAIDSKNYGPKYVGNKLSKCRAIDIDNNINKLIAWKRTARSAYTLSKRTNYENDVFAKLAAIRPKLALKTGLRLIKQRGDKVDLSIWETIKPIVQKLDLPKITYCHYLAKQLEDIYAIPMKIRPEYSTIIYTSLLYIDQQIYYAMPTLCHVEILLPEVEEQFIEHLVTDFLQNSFTADKLSDDWKEMQCNCIYVRILVKYLLLCKNEEEQKQKLEKYLDSFLAVLEQLIQSDERQKQLKKYLPEFLLTLKYSKVFLSTEYVSPLPMIEKIIIWFKKHYSVEEHFKIYAELHLLMLFYKAAQQALNLAPGVFSDKKQTRTKGVEIVGKIFGKYIASEVGNLQSQYFESIPELYVHSILAFLQTFHYYYISSDLLSSIIQGLLEKNINSANRLAIYLMAEERRTLTDENYKQLIKCLSSIDNLESQCFLSGFLM